MSSTGRGYKKVTVGRNLFPKLDPAVAYTKRTQLRTLLDAMLELAQTVEQ